MSRILPTPLVFISGYANTENVFYCLNTIKLPYLRTTPGTQKKRKKIPYPIPYSAAREYPPPEKSYRTTLQEIGHHLNYNEDRFRRMKRVIARHAL